MATVKKVDPEWSPSENRNLKVGEVIEMTDYVTLVRTGAAILVDEEGNEIPLPGQVFTCPICFKGSGTVATYIDHVDSHKRVVSTEEVVKPEPIVSALEEAKSEVKVETKVEEAPLYVSKKTMAEEAAKKAGK